MKFLLGSFLRNFVLCGAALRSMFLAPNFVSILKIDFIKIINSYFSSLIWRVVSIPCVCLSREKKKQKLIAILKVRKSFVSWGFVQVAGEDEEAKAL